MMRPVGQDLKVYLYRAPIDMRRGRGAVVTDAAAHWQSLSREIDDLVERARALGMSADTLGSLVKEAFR